MSPLGLLYVYGFLLLFPLTCLAAFRWGEWPERSVALAYLLALAGTEVAAPRGSDFVSFEAGVLVIDFMLLAALVVIAVRSDRTWVIWSAGIHAIATLGHLSKLVSPNLSNLAYGLMEGASAWPALIALMIGTWQAARRRSTTPRSPA